MAERSLRAFEVRLQRAEADIRRLLRERQEAARRAAGSVNVRGGTGGAGGTSPTYVHKQILASDLWVINHNLGSYPSVTTVDSTGREYEGEVSYDNDRRLRVAFSAPFSGEAYLN